MNDFVPKPIEPTRLYQTMARWLTLPRARRPAGPQRPRPRKPWPFRARPTACSPIDLTEVSRLFKNSPDKLRRVLDVFLSKTQDDLTRMAAAEGRADLAATGQLAHKLKSSAAALGAMPFARACQEIEQASRAGDLPSVRERVATLPALLAQVSRQLLASRP